MNSTCDDPMKVPDSVIRVGRQSARNDGSASHPAPFPVELPEFLARVWPGRLLDPFMGGGTTLLAAQRLGLCAIGIEIEEHYCAVAVERIEKERARLGKVEPERADVGQQIGLFA